MRSSKHGSPRERASKALDAAAVCFGRKGFYEATFEDVVQESGLSRGSLYWYFDSKEQLYEAVLEHCAARLEAALGADLSELGDGPVIAAFLEGVAADVESQEEAYRVLYWAPRPAAASARVGELTLRFVSYVGRVVAEARRRGELKDGSDEVIVDILHALAEGLIIRRLLDRNFEVARYAATAAGMMRPIEGTGR